MPSRKHACRDIRPCTRAHRARLAARELAAGAAARALPGSGRARRAVGRHGAGAALSSPVAPRVPRARITCAEPISSLARRAPSPPVARATHGSRVDGAAVLAVLALAVVPCPALDLAHARIVLLAHRNAAATPDAGARCEKDGGRCSGGKCQNKLCCSDWTHVPR